MNSHCIVNTFELYKHAAEVNDHHDVYSNIITCVYKNMTATHLIETLQEIFIRFPYSKNYKIQHLETGVRCGHTSSTEITIDKLKGTISIS